MEGIRVGSTGSAGISSIPSSPTRTDDIGRVPSNISLDAKVRIRSRTQDIERVRDRKLDPQQARFEKLKQFESQVGSFDFGPRIGLLDVDVTQFPPPKPAVEFEAPDPAEVAKAKREGAAAAAVDEEYRRNEAKRKAFAEATDAVLGPVPEFQAVKNTPTPRRESSYAADYTGYLEAYNEVLEIVPTTSVSV